MKVSRELYEEMARVGTVAGVEVVDLDVSDDGNAPVDEAQPVTAPAVDGAPPVDVAPEGDAPQA